MSEQTQANPSCGRLFKSYRQRCSTGQGVIEYAGAIVIAAFLVSLAIFIVPEEVAGMITSIINTSVSFFMEFLPGADAEEA